MCGIAGLANWGDRATLTRMTDIQAHRGPDDRGVWEHDFPDGGWFGLGSRRLAIVDLSPAGHMPMSNENGSLWITYNGEVYNFLELRRELEALGETFVVGSPMCQPRVHAAEKTFRKALRRQEADDAAHGGRF